MQIEALLELFGWLATVLILLAFALNSFGRLDSSRPLFHWLNLIGALGVCLVSWHKGAFQPAFLNFVWMLIALFALIRLFWRKEPYVKS